MNGGYFASRAKTRLRGHAMPGGLCRASGGPWAASAAWGRGDIGAGVVATVAKLVAVCVMQPRGVFDKFATLRLLDCLARHLMGFTAAHGRTRFGGIETTHPWIIPGPLTAATRPPTSPHSWQRGRIRAACRDQEKRHRVPDCTPLWQISVSRSEK